MTLRHLWRREWISTLGTELIRVAEFDHPKSDLMKGFDDRWTERTLEWTPGGAECSRGRPPTRWGDVSAAPLDQLRAQWNAAERPRLSHS
ncbi:hypothetical protein RB195_003718 [Necator americanus]|uniref:Uncharacterized protein n=1 Tax=Necator americanus TaxID=51031 RepID=A0ABR1DRC7_NECAM